MNTQQRELLQRAANAAGYLIEWRSARILFWRTSGFFKLEGGLVEDDDKWDPLESDTDLLTTCTHVAQRHGLDEFLAALKKEIKAGGYTRLAMVAACAAFGDLK